jgi:hypothetical protein
MSAPRSTQEGNTTMARTPARRRLALVAMAAGLLLVAGACSQQMRAERDGRDLAEALCDLDDATDADAAATALADIESEIDDLVQRYGMATAEDRADISNNLADLAEHAVQGNEVLLQQDLAVLQRSAENVRQDAGDVQAAVWTGISDGLQECVAD